MNNFALYHYCSISALYQRASSNYSTILYSLQQFSRIFSIIVLIIYKNRQIQQQSNVSHFVRVGKQNMSD